MLQALSARLSQVSVWSNRDALDPDCLGKCRTTFQKPERERVSKRRAFRVSPQSMARAQSNCVLVETIYSPPKERIKLIYHTEINSTQCNCADGLFYQKYQRAVQPSPGFACFRGRPPPGHCSHPRLLPLGISFSFFYWIKENKDVKCAVARKPESLLSHSIPMTEPFAGLETGCRSTVGRVLRE